MSRHPSLLSIIMVFFAIIVSLMFVQYSQDAVQKFNEDRLNYAVNYSTEAAVDELIRYSADLGMDYADYDRVSVDPEVALKMFCTIFAKNYNLAATTENYNLIKTDYIKTFLVAVYDGYYIAEPTKINDSGAHDVIFKMKQPYYHLAEDKKLAFGFNLGLKDAKCIDLDRGLLMKVNVANPDEADYYYPEGDQLSYISQCVSDSFMESVYRSKETDVHSTVYIPSAMSKLTTTNPINRITVMAYLSDVDFDYGSALETFGIGGARIEHARWVGCYVKDGVKQYAFVEQIPEGVTVIEHFESPERAAEEGYYFDLSTLGL